MEALEAIKTCMGGCVGLSESWGNQILNFHEELEVCVPWVGQALLGAIFWQAGNKINRSYESESFSVHIASFILSHI